jgi:WhiB family redox-sensing transcriptional regulator
MTLVDRVSPDATPVAEAQRADAAVAYARWQRWQSLMAPEGSGLIAYDDLVRRPGWMARAACHGQGTAAFFRPFGAEGGAAKAICAQCDVRPECLQHALADPELRGVWGGTSERERQRMRRAGTWNGRRCAVPVASR